MKLVARCLCMTFLMAVSAGAADLRVGHAAVDITPPVGMAMGGYFRVRLNTGTHDPLHAKAIVLEEGGVEAALVACDLVNLSRDFVDAARRIIGQTTHVPPENVMISATHSHTGPEMNHTFLDLLDGSPAQIAREYRATLAGKIAKSVQEAEANLQPVEASAGIGHEPSLCFNRRYVMRDGTIGWNPGKMNPNIVRPAGPVDPDVSVVFFQGTAHQPVATFVNYAVHLDTTGGTEYSADYAYTLGKLLAAATTPEMFTLFTIGAAGNINHINVNTPERQSGFQEATRIGTILAGDVLKSYSHLTPVSGPLQVRRGFIDVPLQKIAPGDVERSREMVTRAVKQDAHYPFLDLVRAVKILLLAEYHGKPLHAEVDVVSIGRDVAWVELPGEIFVELGMAIKNASPFRYTIVDELSSDNIHYVPDLKAFAEDNYEPTNSIIAPGGGEALVGAATGMLIKSYESAAR